jgi:hypothetical protein
MIGGTRSHEHFTLLTLRVHVTPWTVCQRGGSTPSGWKGSGGVGDMSGIGEM